MITDYLKKIFNTPSKKRLAENYISLTFLQVTNYLLPLITLPYLVRVLGPEKYGLLAFAQSFIQYFNIFTDYGFNFSATRELSIHREDKRKVSQIFSSVMALKIIFVGISFILLTIIVFSFEKFLEEWLVYYLTFGIIIGQNLFPRWFFQGMERMKYITILNILAKLIFTLLIFLLIKKSTDYIIVPLINSLGFLISGVIAIRLVYREFRVRFIMPTLAELKHQAKEGWHLFISTLATSLYTTSNSFILGVFTNNTFVGYYSAAERIVKALEEMLSPVFHSVYPYLSRLTTDSTERALDFLKKLVRTVGIIGVFISFFVFIFANMIVNVLLGTDYLESVIVIRILSLLPLIGGLNIILTSLTMLSFNFKKAFSNIIIGAGVVDIFFSFILIPFYKHVGSSLAVILAELFILFSTNFYLRNKGINLLLSVKKN